MRGGMTGIFGNGGRNGMKRAHDTDGNPKPSLSGGPFLPPVSTWTWVVPLDFASADFYNEI